MSALLPVQDQERARERADNSGCKVKRVKASEWRRDLKRLSEDGDGGWGGVWGGGVSGIGGGGMSSVGGGTIGGVSGGGVSSGLAVFRRRIERASRLAAFEGNPEILSILSNLLPYLFDLSYLVYIFLLFYPPNLF